MFELRMCSRAPPGKLFVIFGALGLGLIFALAYILGQTSQDKTQRGLEEKLYE